MAEYVLAPIRSPWNVPVSLFECVETVARDSSSCCVSAHAPFFPWENAETGTIVGQFQIGGVPTGLTICEDVAHDWLQLKIFRCRRGLSSHAMRKIIIDC